MFLQNMKISRRIILLVGSLLVFMIAISVTAYFGLNQMDDQGHVILEHAYEMEQSGDLQLKLSNLIMPVNDYLITKDLKMTKDEFQKNLKELNEALAKKKANEGLNQKEKDALKTIESKVTEVIGYANKIFTIADITVNQQGSELMEKMDTVAYEAVETSEELHEVVKSDMKNAEKNADAINSTVLITIAIVSAFSIILGLLLGIFIARSINSPLALLRDRLKDIAEGDGDLTARVELKSKDELGEVAVSFNTFVAKLHDLIVQIIVSSQNLAQAVQQIASGNENLSQRTSEQASSLEEVASTIEEATATINQNAENASRAKDLTDGGAEKSNEGNKIAVEAVNAINEMNESSKKVAEIISVINEIAFQTNLLALNASVEAARAGEQGRGFAVVAGEVRNLAQRSANAAGEIEELIKNTVDKVEKGTELVNKTGEALGEIRESAITVAQIISEIAAASTEQKAGINQINTAISEMDTMTQQNASLVEETASASEEMSNQAQELLQMMDQFKVGDSSVHDALDLLQKKQMEFNATHQETMIQGKQDTKEAVISLQEKDGNGRGLSDVLKQEGFEEF